MVDMKELIRRATEARKEQAPRNRRALEDRIYTLVAIHLAADHFDKYNPNARGIEPADRVTNLLRHDSLFYAKTMALHANLMQTLEDYASQTGLDLQ